MNKACALTGHRTLDRNFNENGLYDRLEALVREGYDTFFCGMAAGFDLAALECLVNLKQKYRIFIEACIPFKGQESAFSASEKQKYRALLCWCDRKTVLFEKYCNGCYLARNRYMVDRSDAVLAHCNQETGGTAYTVRYAREKNVPVIFVD